MAPKPWRPYRAAVPMRPDSSFPLWDAPALWPLPCSYHLASTWAVLFQHPSHTRALRPLLFALFRSWPKHISTATSFLYEFPHLKLSQWGLFDHQLHSGLLPRQYGSFSALHVSFIHGSCHHLTQDRICVFMMFNVGALPCKRHPIKGDLFFCLFCSLKYRIRLPRLSSGEESAFQCKGSRFNLWRGN